MGDVVKLTLFVAARTRAPGRWTSPESTRASRVLRNGREPRDGSALDLPGGRAWSRPHYLIEIEAVAAKMLLS